MILPTYLKRVGVLSERYYATFALWHEPSVFRLSVVCNVVAQHTQRFELPAIFLHLLIA